MFTPAMHLQSRLVVLGTVASALTAWGLRRSVHWFSSLAVWATAQRPGLQCNRLPLSQPVGRVAPCCGSSCTGRWMALSSATPAACSPCPAAAPTPRQPPPLGPRLLPTSSSLACEQLGGPLVRGCLDAQRELMPVAGLLPRALCNLPPSPLPLPPGRSTMNKIMSASSIAS